ncbi:MAG: hypothetical protein R2695_06485 [Acidimicrobiales bacterium]
MLQQRSWDTPTAIAGRPWRSSPTMSPPSLKWASAEIRKNEFRGDGGQSAGGGGRAPAANQPPPAYDMDEEPF